MHTLVTYDNDEMEANDELHYRPQKQATGKAELKVLLQ